MFLCIHPVADACHLGPPSGATLYSIVTSADHHSLFAGSRIIKFGDNIFAA